LLHFYSKHKYANLLKNLIHGFLKLRFLAFK
jgi:hypothetical protein